MKYRFPKYISLLPLVVFFLLYALTLLFTGTRSHTIASSLSGINPMKIIPYLYYLFLLGIAAVLSILFQYPKKYTFQNNVKDEKMKKMPVFSTDTIIADKT